MLRFFPLIFWFRIFDLFYIVQILLLYLNLIPHKSLIFWEF
jgi:hypothetical protein